MNRNFTATHHATSVKLRVSFALTLRKSNPIKSGGADQQENSIWIKLILTRGKSPFILAIVSRKRGKKSIFCPDARRQKRGKSYFPAMMKWMIDSDNDYESGKQDEEEDRASECWIEADGVSLNAVSATL